VGTHMQLELGAQQRAAAVVVRAGDEAEDGLSLLMGVVSEHAPLVAGFAAEVLGDVVSGWVDSLRAFTADLQGYADALVAVDRDVAGTDGEQREGFVASSSRIAGRMGGVEAWRRAG